jgi:hypothetical protein
MTDETSVRMIRLADGTLIDPLTRAPVVASGSRDSRVDDDGAGGNHPLEDIPTSPNTIVPLARRSLLDLTLNPQQMAVVNNVLVYSMWGLPDDEIAIQCNCTVPDVHTVRDLHEYRTMHDALVAGVRASYSASAHGVISQNAVAAAHVVVSTLRSASKRMQLDAAKDILDRSGHRPTDHASINIALNRDSEDTLVIRVVRDSEKPHIPGMTINAA